MTEFKLPDPVKVNQWGTQLRYTAILLGGMGFGSTWLGKVSGLSDNDLNQYITVVATVISAILWLGPAAWGWVNNKFIDRDIKEVIVASSVASAVSGKPVVAEVVQTEKGIKNIALPMEINATEIYNAAVVSVSPREMERTRNLNLEEAARHQ